MSTREPLAAPGPVHHLLRRTVHQFSIAITLVLLLLGLFVGYQVWNLRNVVLRTYADMEPLLLSNETIALVERTAHVLRSMQAVLDEPDTVQEHQMEWAGQLVGLHAALDSNRRDLERFIDRLPADDPLQAPLARSWALLRETTRLVQEIIQAVNHGRWGDVEVLIRRFFNVYEEYHLAQRFVVREFEQRRDATLVEMLRALRRILFQPAITVFVSLILVWMFARFIVVRIITPVEDTAEGVLRFAEGDYHHRLEVEEHARDEVSHLRRVFNLMADQVQAAQLTLEQRVAERTYALQRRVAQIQAAADIARLLASVRTPESLLDNTVRLIAERFGFYHVGIFLIDETGEWMELRAASSEGGQRMVERGHRLRVGEEGVVGFVARTGNPRIVLDVDEDPHYVRPEELPLTRSEMALPLRVGGRVLGVLDIQSTRPNAFSPEDVTTLRIVADQMAVALDNAFLLQRMERALDELHWVQRQLSRRGWEEFLRVVPARFYRRTARGDFDARSEPDPHVEASAPAGYALDVPIAVREQPIAVLHLRRHKPWTATERQMLHDLAARLGVALESARLYYIAQRRTAWLQAAVELSRAMRAWDEETLLREFARALVERFPLWRAVVYRHKPAERLLEVAAAAGHDAARLQRPRPHAVPTRGDDIIAVVARRREPLLLNAPEAMQAYTDQAPVPPGRARVLLPVLLGDTLFGVVDLHAERPRAFLEADLTVLRLLIDALAVALLNAQLVARLRLLLGEQQRLQEALAQATAAVSVPEALEVVIQALYELEAPQSVAIYLPLETEPSKLHRVIHRHHPEAGTEWEEWVDLTADETHPVAWAFAHQAARWFNEVMWHEGRMLGGASVIVTPIVYGDEPLGVVAFRHGVANAYSEDFWGLAHAAAAAIASLLSNLRLLEQVQRRSTQLQLLYDFTAAISGYTDFQSLVTDAVRRLRQIFDGLHAGILVYDEVRPQAHLVASTSRSPDAPGADWHRMVLPLEPGTPLARLRQQPRVLVVTWEQLRHAPEHFRQAVQRRGVRSQVFAPLVVAGEVMGVVALGFETEEPPLGTSDLAVLEQLARQLSLAVELTRLLERLERRAARERWVREITVRMRSSNDPMAILRIALEGLKEQLHLQEAQILLTRTGPTNLETDVPSEGGNGHGPRPSDNGEGPEEVT